MKRLFSVPGALDILALGIIGGSSGTSLADETDVPMQGSEIKLFAGCDDFQGMLFVRPGQALAGQDGWDMRTDHATHNFSCGWSRQDAARCQSMGYEPRDEGCTESPGIIHGPGR